MRLSTREDISAASGPIFDRLADFALIEGEARRRGIELKRLDDLGLPGAGMCWELGLVYRGKPRAVLAELIRFDRPEALDYRGLSGSYEATLELRLLELSRERTRLIVALEVKPRTLAGRLVIQSAKLGRAKLERRFAEKVRRFAATLGPSRQA